MFFSLSSLAGNLFDESDVLDWLLGQLSSDAIEEVTGSMLHRLVAESKNLAVLFCKYVGYVVIALTHTCYLLKHYAPSNNAPPETATPSTSTKPKSFMPVDRVKGLARETKF